MNESVTEDGRRQSILKQRSRFPLQEVALFYGEEDTATLTRGRRVSFGRNLVKEYLVGSAASTMAVHEYEKPSESLSEASDCSGPLDLALSKTTNNIDNHDCSQVIAPPDSFTDSASVESEQRVRRFTEGCISLAKSVLSNPETELTAIIIQSQSSKIYTNEEERKNSSISFANLDVSQLNEQGTLKAKQTEFVSISHDEIFKRDFSHNFDKSRFEFLDRSCGIKLSPEIPIRSHSMPGKPILRPPVTRHSQPTPHFWEENEENIPPRFSSQHLNPGHMTKITDDTMEYTAANNKYPYGEQQSDFDDSHDFPQLNKSYANNFALEDSANDITMEETCQVPRNMHFDVSMDESIPDATVNFPRDIEETCRDPLGILNDTEESDVTVSLYNMKGPTFLHEGSGSDSSPSDLALLNTPGTVNFTKNSFANGPDILSSINNELKKVSVVNQSFLMELGVMAQDECDESYQSGLPDLVEEPTIDFTPRKLNTTERNNVNDGNEMSADKTPASTFQDDYTVGHTWPSDCISSTRYGTNDSHRLRDVCDSAVEVVKKPPEPMFIQQPKLNPSLTEDVELVADENDGAKIEDHDMDVDELSSHYQSIAMEPTSESHCDVLVTKPNNGIQPSVQMTDQQFELVNKSLQPNPEELYQTKCGPDMPANSSGLQNIHSIAGDVPSKPEDSCSSVNKNVCGELVVEPLTSQQLPTEINTLLSSNEGNDCESSSPVTKSILRQTEKTEEAPLQGEPFSISETHTPDSPRCKSSCLIPSGEHHDSLGKVVPEVICPKKEQNDSDSEIEEPLSLQVQPTGELSEHPTSETFSHSKQEETVPEDISILGNDNISPSVDIITEGDVSMIDEEAITDSSQRTEPMVFVDVSGSNGPSDERGELEVTVDPLSIEGDSPFNDSGSDVPEVPVHGDFPMETTNCNIQVEQTESLLSCTAADSIFDLLPSKELNMSAMLGTCNEEEGNVTDSYKEIERLTVELQTKDGENCPKGEKAVAIEVLSLVNNEASMNNCDEDILSKTSCDGDKTFTKGRSSLLPVACNEETYVAGTQASNTFTLKNVDDTNNGEQTYTFSAEMRQSELFNASKRLHSDSPCLGEKKQKKIRASITPMKGKLLISPDRSACNVSKSSPTPHDNDRSLKDWTASITEHRLGSYKNDETLNEFLLEPTIPKINKSIPLSVLEEVGTREIDDRETDAAEISACSFVSLTLKDLSITHTTQANNTSTPSSVIEDIRSEEMAISPVKTDVAIILPDIDSNNQSISNNTEKEGNVTAPVSCESSFSEIRANGHDSSESLSLLACSRLGNISSQEDGIINNCSEIGVEQAKPNENSMNTTNDIADYHELSPDRPDVISLEEPPEGDSNTHSSISSERGGSVSTYTSGEMMLSENKASEHSFSNSLSLSEENDLQLSPNRSDAKDHSMEVDGNINETFKSYRKRQPILDRIDNSVLRMLQERVLEKNCLWKLVSFKEYGKAPGLIVVEFPLLDTSVLLSVEFRRNEIDCTITKISVTEVSDKCFQDSSQIEINKFGVHLLKNYIFDEEKKMKRSFAELPYFLDFFNAFTTRVVATMKEALIILQGCAGSRLNGHTISFRLHSFCFMFSCRVALNLRDAIMDLPKLRFDHEMGNLDESALTLILSSTWTCTDPLISFVRNSHDYIVKLDRERGFATKRPRLLF